MVKRAVSVVPGDLTLFNDGIGQFTRCWPDMAPKADDSFFWKRAVKSLVLVVAVDTHPEWCEFGFVVIDGTPCWISLRSTGKV